LLTQSRAVVFPAPHAKPELRLYPIPDLQPGAILLKVLLTEVCGTDVHLQQGRLAGVPYPLIPGHVSIGEAVAVSGEVRDVEGNSLKVGETLTFLDVIETCGNCWYCLVAKASTRCPLRKVYGITLGADEAPGLAGGWSEYMILRAGTKCLKLKSGVTPEAFIGAGCGLPTAVHAIERADITLGDRVLIQGSGPVGLSACALALLSGAGWVGVIGAPEFRLQAARDFGADFTLDVTTTTPAERLKAVRDATGGRGADIVIEASGNPHAVPEGCDLTRDGGRFVIVGQYTDHGDIPLNPHLQINKKQLEIRGCWGSDFSHVHRAMSVLSRFGGRMDWSSLISKTYTLDDAGQALDDVANQRVVKAVISPGR